jgi:hypothetical protein
VGADGPRRGAGPRGRLSGSGFTALKYDELVDRGSRGYAPGMRGRWLVCGALAACGGGLPAEQKAPEAAAPAQAPAQESAQVQAPAKEQAQPPKEEPVDDGFDAVVRVDEKPGGKKFQGVWLEREDGERWVVAYRPEAWLRVFEGRTVRVTGETYQPFGQAINSTHFRVFTLTVKEEKRGIGPLLGVGREQTLRGRFVDAVVPKGAKNEGDTYRTFVADGGAEFMIEEAPEGAPVGKSVQIVARAVEPDWSYHARRGGDYLWIIKVEEVEAK